MGIEALKAWRAIPPDVIEACRMSLPARHRPSRHAMELVAQSLALGVIEPGGKLKQAGFTDKSIQQVIDECHGVVTYEQVRAALRALEKQPLFKTIRRSTRGKEGGSGRAPRRVMYCYDPCNHLKQSGLNPTSISQDSECGEKRISVGSNEVHRGAYLTALIQDLFTDPYTDTDVPEFAYEQNTRPRERSSHIASDQAEQPY